MSILAANSHVLCGEFYNKYQQQQQYLQSRGGSGTGTGTVLLQKNHYYFGIDGSRRSCKQVVRRRDELRVEAFWADLMRSKPTSVDMEPINDTDHLDQILLHAQELSQPIIIDWMASWCRKCIYLKPKLEKLAAEYDTKAKFYYVDVNKVPQALVKRGNISKMPTIQLWKDGEMKAEVIGGHKAWLVMDEVREMIQKFL